MTIITVGTFDLLHYGHIRLFKRCSELGELVVGVNSDEFVDKYKGKRPIMSYYERETTIRDLGYKTIKNDQLDGTIKSIINEINPNIIAIGSDWMRKPYLGQIGLSADYLEKKQIGLLYLPYTPNISTTELKERLASHSDRHNS